jgi:hypothetical protein
LVYFIREKIMKTKKNYFTNGNFVSIVGGLILAALLFAACNSPAPDPNAAENPAPDISLAEGTGVVPLSLDGQSGGALAPVVFTLTPALSISRYTISFSGGPSSQAAISDWNGVGTKNITLPVGTWTITVAGFLSDGKKVREGAVTGIVITDRGTADPVNIGLSPIFNAAGGTGTFSYATGTGGIDFSAVPDVDFAALKITPLDSSGTTEKNLLAVDEAKGSITLAAGQYNMKIGRAHV